MAIALWSINVLLTVIALVFLPTALRRHDRIMLTGIGLAIAGFTLATSALLSM